MGMVIGGIEDVGIFFIVVGVWFGLMYNKMLVSVVVYFVLIEGVE